MFCKSWQASVHNRTATPSRALIFHGGDVIVFVIDECGTVRLCLPKSRAQLRVAACETGYANSRLPYVFSFCFPQSVFLRRH